MKKLNFKKKTIANLSENEMDKIRGATLVHHTCNCDETRSCTLFHQCCDPTEGAEGDAGDLENYS